MAPGGSGPIQGGSLAPKMLHGVDLVPQQPVSSSSTQTYQVAPTITKFIAKISENPFVRKIFSTSTQSSTPQISSDAKDDDDNVLLMILLGLKAAVVSNPISAAAVFLVGGLEVAGPELDKDVGAALELKAAEWERSRKMVETSNIERRMSGWVMVRYDGVPEDVKRVVPKGVYRHYVQTKEQLEEIVRSGRLIEGATPSWVVSNNAVFTYDSVKGLFLTRPWVRPETIGCSGAAGYVDVLIPEDVPMFLVPFYTGAQKDAFVIPGLGGLRVVDALVKAGNPSGLDERRSVVGQLYEYQNKPQERIDYLASAPQNLLRVELPVVVLGNSLDVSMPAHDSLEGMLQTIAKMDMPKGLEVLSYHIAKDWKGLLKLSGLVLGAVQYKQPPKSMYHGMEHLLSSAALSVWIGARENAEAGLKYLQVLWYSGLLHDVGRSDRYGVGEDPEHAETSARMAETFLRDNGVATDVIEKVVLAIRDHTRSHSEVTQPESLILKDVDSLERFRLGPDSCDPKYLTTEAARVLLEPVRLHYNPPPNVYPDYAAGLIGGSGAVAAEFENIAAGKLPGVGMPEVAIDLRRAEAVIDRVEKAGEAARKAGERIETGIRK